MQETQHVYLDIFKQNRNCQTKIIILYIPRLILCDASD